MEDDEGESATRYVFGKMSPCDTRFPTLLAITATKDGWRVRSTDRAYNHDYICYETFEEVMEWLDAELHRPFIAIDRSEAIDTLVHDTSEHRCGFLYPGNAVSGSREEAKIVLSHLEGGARH